MASWYRTGSINLVNGSKNVTGNGTAWLDAKVGIGEALRAPDGGLHEIESIDSNGLIKLAVAYPGASVNGVGYMIVPTQAYMRDIATKLSALLTEYGAIAEMAGAGRFAAGATEANVLKPSVRGAADEDTGLDLPGGNIVRLMVGGLLGLQIAADGTPTGLAVQKLPVLHLEADGTAIQMSPETDMRAVERTGSYKGSGWLNAPTASSWHYLNVLKHDDAWKELEAINYFAANGYPAGARFRCGMRNGTWSDWQVDVDSSACSSPKFAIREQIGFTAINAGPAWRTLLRFRNDADRSYWVSAKFMLVENSMASFWDAYTSVYIRQRTTPHPNAYNLVATNVGATQGSTSAGVVAFQLIQDAGGDYLLQVRNTNYGMACYLIECVGQGTAGVTWEM